MPTPPIGSKRRPLSRLGAQGSAVLTAAALLSCSSGTTTNPEFCNPLEATVRVSMSETSIQVFIGDEVILSATAIGPNGCEFTDQPSNWESSNTDVATVASGRVRGVGPGNAQISATVRGSTAQTRVDVPPDTGTVQVALTETDPENGPDNYRVLLESADRTVSRSSAITPGSGVDFSGLPVGAYQVQLQGEAANCSVDQNPRSATVTARTVTAVAFNVVCAATRGAIEVAVTTTGAEPDDGYDVLVDGSVRRRIGANAVEQIGGFEPGDYTVRLGDIASNCADPGSRVVTVVAGESRRVTFEVACQRTTGDLRVETRTIGEDLDPDGYQVDVGGTVRSIGVNDQELFTDLQAGLVDVTLAGVAENCAIDGPATRTTSIAAGQVSEVLFDLTCEGTTPTIGLSTNNLSFTAQEGTNPGVQIVTLSNTGAGTLVWNLTTSATWLQAAPQGAKRDLAPGESQDLVISVSTAGLAPGTYNGTVTVSAPDATNSPRAIAVTLTVTSAQAPPTIGLSTTSLAFNVPQGTDSAGMTVVVSNTGGGTMAWDRSTSAGWILAGVPGMKRDLGPGDSQNMVVSVFPGGFGPGTYVGTVTVTAPGATNTPRTINVTLTVTANQSPPTIGLSTTNVAFTVPQGTDSAGATVVVSNTGGGTMEWNRSTSAGWILAGVPGMKRDLGPGESQNMVISVFPGGFAAGTYNGTVTVTAPGATNTPRTINVTLTVTANASPPTIGLSTTSLTFTAPQGSDPPSQTVIVSNTGGGIMEWNRNTSAGWIIAGVPGTKRDLGPGESQDMVVRLDSDTFSPGTYNGTVTVFANGATNTPRTITVTLTVTTPLE